MGLTPGSGRSPGGGYGDPLQYSCLENPMEERSLVGYSPWGHEESDTTEGLSAHIRNSGVSSFPLGFVPMSLHHPLPFEVPSWDFPGGPVIKTPCFQCRGCGCDRWVGKLRFHMSHSVSPPKKFFFSFKNLLKCPLPTWKSGCQQDLFSQPQDHGRKGIFLPGKFSKSLGFRYSSLHPIL